VTSSPDARDSRRHLSGLQGERTLLAWDRTAMSLLANAGLLVLREAGDSHPLRLIDAVVACFLAAMCGMLARTRAAAIARRVGDHDLPGADRAVVVLAAGIAVMCVLEVIAIFRA
jgi:uncharacterized membrane protein YidH (DUF202 family)